MKYVLFSQASRQEPCSFSCMVRYKFNQLSVKCLLWRFKILYMTIIVNSSTFLSILFVLINSKLRYTIISLFKIEFTRELKMIVIGMNSKTNLWRKRELHKYFHRINIVVISYFV